MPKEEHYCDSCGEIATHNVSQYDSYYEYLCDDCYDEWCRDKNLDFDEFNY